MKVEIIFGILMIGVVLLSGCTGPSIIVINNSESRDCQVTEINKDFETGNREENKTAFLHLIPVELICRCSSKAVIRVCHSEEQWEKYKDDDFVRDYIKYDCDEGEG